MDWWMRLLLHWVTFIHPMVFSCKGYSYYCWWDEALDRLSYWSSIWIIDRLRGDVTWAIKEDAVEVCTYALELGLSVDGAVVADASSSWVGASGASTSLGTSPAAVQCDSLRRCSSCVRHDRLVISSLCWNHDSYPTHWSHWDTV